MIRITLIQNGEQKASKWIHNTYKSIYDTKKLWRSMYKLDGSAYQIYITIQSKAK